MMIRDADYLGRHLALAGGRQYSLLIARRRQQPIGYLLHRILPGHSLRAFGPVRVGIVTDYLVDDAGRDNAAGHDRGGVPPMVGPAGRDR